MERVKRTYNPCDDCEYSYSKNNQESNMCKICEFKTYFDADRQGKLIILPCKIGDTVYTACSWGIESGVVGSIEIFDDRIFVNNVHGTMIAEAHNVFHTKEEAEQALAKMKEV